MNMLERCRLKGDIAATHAVAHAAFVANVTCYKFEARLTGVVMTQECQ